VDFGGLLLLGLVWFIFNLLSKKREPGSAPHPGRPRPTPRTVTPQPGSDPTQREGSRLELLLKQMERALTDASGPGGRPATTSLPQAGEVEERESLEVAPEVESLEGEVRRPARAVVDRDDEVEAVEARRIAAAAERGGSQTSADHASFDRQIRAQPADHTAVRGYTAKQLRDAVVWREILGPPKSLE
jgi:hypothetical protein